MCNYVHPGSSCLFQCVGVLLLRLHKFMCLSTTVGLTVTLVCMDIVCAYVSPASMCSSDNTYAPSFIYFICVRSVVSYAQVLCDVNYEVYILFSSCPCAENI